MTSGGALVDEAAIGQNARGEPPNLTDSRVPARLADTWRAQVKPSSAVATASLCRYGVALKTLMPVPAAFGSKMKLSVALAVYAATEWPQQPVCVAS